VGEVEEEGSQRGGVSERRGLGEKRSRNISDLQKHMIGNVNVLIGSVRVSNSK